MRERESVGAFGAENACTARWRRSTCAPLRQIQATVRDGTHENLPGCRCQIRSIRLSYFPGTVCMPGRVAFCGVLCWHCRQAVTVVTPLRRWHTSFYQAGRTPNAFVFTKRAASRHRSCSAAPFVGALILRIACDTMNSFGNPLGEQRQHKSHL